MAVGSSLPRQRLGEPGFKLGHLNFFAWGFSPGEGRKWQKDDQAYRRRSRRRKASMRVTVFNGDGRGRWLPFAPTKDSVMASRSTLGSKKEPKTHGEARSVGGWREGCRPCEGSGGKAFPAHDPAILPRSQAARCCKLCQGTMPRHAGSDSQRDGTDGFVLECRHHCSPAGRGGCLWARRHQIREAWQFPPGSINKGKRRALHIRQKVGLERDVRIWPATTRKLTFHCHQHQLRTPASLLSCMANLMVPAAMMSDRAHVRMVSGAESPSSGRWITGTPGTRW